MKSLKGTKTEANLAAAYAGESEARNKYTYYASKAKKDGYVQIGELFEATANNEKEHAKIWFKLLHDGAVPGTEENLKDAAAGEHYEWTEMYPKSRNCSRMSRESWCSLARATQSGNAATADISWSAPPPPRSAPYALIPRAISDWPRGIIDIPAGAEC